jgi:hypothetical protein
MGKKYNVPCGTIRGCCRLQQSRRKAFLIKGPRLDGEQEWRKNSQLISCLSIGDYNYFEPFGIDLGFVICQVLQGKLRKGVETFEAAKARSTGSRAGGILLKPCL